ncbi:MAG TPA: succinylglutamate-semialdehyde dehydrogenase [Chthoniobacterales bacterium]
MNPTPHFIGGCWIAGNGPAFTSTNPSNGESIWQGAAADPGNVDDAVHAARVAFPGWAALPVDARAEHLRAFASALEADAANLGRLISLEVGKPLWESATEVKSMIGKCELTISAYARRCAEFSGGGAVTRFRPHGVVAVLGPFNFPGHLANGHIMPALLAGNTVIFKPSDKAPLVAERTVQLWEKSGLPVGVLNLLQGTAEPARALAAHDGVDGIFFTGSSRAGIALNEAAARKPGKILALEMGGNNPLVVHDPGDLTTAAFLTAQSAFITSGQRCTCARRLYVTAATPLSFLEKLTAIAGALHVGPPEDDPEPFAGPLISAEAASVFLRKQEELRATGAGKLLEGRSLRAGTGLVSPAIWNVTELSGLSDEETFGPLLQVVCVETLEDAIQAANDTAYGLAAGIITQDRVAYETFRDSARAGIINWNQQLTGASGAAPFGGIGLSGNHRPSAYFAADYCSYPVASMEVETPQIPSTLPPGVTLY